MKPLRVAVCGFGNMGKNHARVVSQMPETQLVSIFDPNPSTDFGLHRDKRATTFEDLIQSNPDYCVVAAPTSSHLEICQKLMRSNTPFLVEKPISFPLVWPATFICERNGRRSYLKKYQPRI